MLTDIQISKRLSFWLRHRPDAAGLTLTSNGWADIDHVLAAFRHDGSEVTWKQLLAVVEANDKQRFEISGDGDLIRARQGHSVSVDGDWQASVPPARLYHGTVERFLSPILADGLKPMRRHHVHLSADVATAERVGQRRGSPVILEIDAAGLAAKGEIFYLTTNNVWLVAHVPPDFIRPT